MKKLTLVDRNKFIMYFDISASAVFITTILASGKHASKILTIGSTYSIQSIPNTIRVWFLKSLTEFASVRNSGLKLTPTFSYSLFKIYKTKKILHKEIVFASIGVSVYLILNKYIFGTYLPISLLNNLSFNFMENYAVIFNTFISNTEYSFNAFNTSIFEHPLFWRIIQAYFPFLFSIYFYRIINTCQ